ncbi:MAG: PAS domain S-box protein [Anaerolineae bacterium]|nr:PAS domain S-box protein [Anaerolineae bacterium]
MTSNPFAPANVPIAREIRLRMIRTIIVGLMVFSLLFISGALLAFHEILTRSLTFGVGVVVVGVAALVLLNKGYEQLPSILVVTFLWLITFVGALTNGGLHAPIYMGSLIVILTGWALGGKLGGQIAIIACLISSGILYLAEINGMLSEREEYTPLTLFAIYIFFLAVVFLFQRAQEAILTDALTRARNSDEQYRSLLENIPVITYINDLSGSALTIYVSPQVEGLVGYSQRELMEDPLMWTKLIPSEDLPSVTAEVLRTTETGEPFNMDYRLIAKSGDTIWVRDEARLVHDLDGKPQYWLGAWTDITNRKTAEQFREETVGDLTARTMQLMTASEVSSAAASILELNELLPKVVELIRAHFDYYYVCIFLADSKNEKAVLRAATGEVGETLLAAGHALPIGNSSMIGWSIANDQARIALDVGKEAVRFVNPLLPLTRSEIALPLRARGMVIGAMGIQSAKEAAFTEWDINALQTMADQVAIAIHTARLFDERTSLLREMETKNAELEQFTYTVSHDLKSPLVTIRGYLGYLRSDAEKGDMTRFDRDLERVVKSTQTMQKLLQDLLELSRVGRVINPIEKISFGELAEETVNLIMSPGQQKKIPVYLQYPFPDVRADKTRMIGVLQNLIANAIKFMGKQESPHVIIGASGMDKNGYPIFFVQDNGIGIDPQYHELVFGLFNRLDSSTTGTGIGLALVKRIIETHGGRVWVESEGHNHGCTFYFSLPPAV